MSVECLEKSLRFPWMPRAAAAGVLMAAILTAAASPARAQRNAELIPFAGYLWGGTLNTNLGDIHVNAAPEYGGMFSVEVRPDYFAEIGYWYQGAEVIARPRGAPDFKIFDLGTHYIQVGGSRPLGYGGYGAGPTPFVTGGIGITIFSPTNVAPTYDIRGTTVLSFGLGGGIRMDINEKVGLRAQARLLLPTQLWGTGVWFGTGGGGLSVSGTSIAQGDALLGLVIKLGS